jgi:addiction module RelE/StbE family toxin
MKIIYSDDFYKKFKRLSESDKGSVKETIRFFQDHPSHHSLRNHPLSWSMSGKRSISVTDDMRIIFIEKWWYIQVLMLDIGGHDEVYFD